jgi:16S rRNA (adenine1518-N6/adenine1519-N6)-dimethyltransferase
MDHSPPVLHWGVPRRLGQHFLIWESILERLAEAACGLHTPRVIEIGPGRGALTHHLLRLTDELHAIELDKSLASYLQGQFAGDSRLHVHQADVLTTDITQWGAATVCGNLPYYITSPIVEKFLRLDERFPVAVFLTQWEVAQRILAGPGSRDYGYLTVAVQLVCEVELVCKVPSSAFAPPPKVDSAAVRFVRKRDIPADMCGLLRFVGRCFAQKRKTLRNNLRPYYGELADVLPESRLRAEQLSSGEFVRLRAQLDQRRSSPAPLYTDSS